MQCATALQDGQAVIHKAALKGRKEVVQVIVSKHETDVNLCDEVSEVAIVAKQHVLCNTW